MANGLKTLRDKENLGDRMIAKGKAGDFRLSDNILSQLRRCGNGRNNGIGISAIDGLIAADKLAVSRTQDEGLCAMP